MLYSPPSLTELAKKLNRPIYIVGGYVRNQLCNLQPAANNQSPDIDIAGDFDGQLLKKAGARIAIINKKLGTMWIEYKGNRFEYTPFRTEEYASGGHHSPINIEFISDINKDARRRDFTANSIYYDVLNQKIVDPLCGTHDAKNKILRCNEAESVFKSDGLRLMRLVRLASELGYEIDEKTKETAFRFRHQLNDISAERKRDELNKILYADKKYGVTHAHYRGLKLLHELRLWEHILPSMTRMKIPQNARWHNYDVLEHTFMAVKFADANIENLRLAALMHDTGKPVCQQLFGKMSGHAAVSGEIALKELGQEGLKYPKSVVSEVVKLCELHMYDLDFKTSENKMRLFCAINFEILEKLQALKYADALATGKNKQELFEHRFLYFRDKLLEEGAPLRQSDLRVSGRDAIEAGYEGEAIRVVLEELWKECLANPSLNERERLLEQLKNRRGS